MDLDDDHDWAPDILLGQKQPNKEDGGGNNK